MALLPFGSAPFNLSSPPAGKILPIANGGTGSATQNFVDLSSTQTAAGNKTFSGNVVVGGTLEAAGTIIFQTGLPSASTAAIGGYYDGLGVGGLGNSGTNTPMFGVLAKNQGGNGIGNVAFTVMETNAIYSYHNSLDDGSGNIVPGTNASYNLGSTSDYWQYIYGSRLYLNSTAYLDGGSAGVAALTGNMTVSGTMTVVSYLQGYFVTAYGADAEFTLINTNDSTTDHGFWTVTYNSNMIGYSQTTSPDYNNVLYVGNRFGSGHTVIGTAHKQAVNSATDLAIILDDGLGNLILQEGLLFPIQAPTVSAPSYVKGGIYFDTTLNKLRVGGAAAWETITSA